ncbi:MAG: DUF4199 domain-containing protein [Bacteroidetes bacterium]|nr:DUF4199 domain-containing protein [Bacteroidota bacterium]
MEEKKRSVSANALNYGLIAGAAVIVYSLLLYIANLYMNQALGYVGYVILLGVMVWGTLDYRKKTEKGFMTYGQAFTSCFLIGLIAGILASVYMLVFAQFINPGLINEILDKARTQLQEKNLTEEQIEAALVYTRKFTSPLMMMIFGFLAYAVISAILSLLAAIFLKKDDPGATTSAL